METKVAGDDFDTIDLNSHVFAVAIFWAFTKCDHGLHLQVSEFIDCVGVVVTVVFQSASLPSMWPHAVWTSTLKGGLVRQLFIATMNIKWFEQYKGRQHF